VLFDLTPIPAAVDHPAAPWSPRGTPSGLDMAARGVRGLIALPFEAASRALDAVSHPGDALHGTREALEGLGEVVWAGLNPAPDTPLNVEIGPHRRLVWVRHELSDFKKVKDALGGTVNDVVLATVAGALQKWLRSRGVRTEGLELRALVPVSIRGRNEQLELGNRIAAMRGPLPVYVEDPVARLQVVRHAMDGLKDSKQALGAEVLAGMQALAPPTIFAQASRLNFSTRLFNLLVTNVPGPQVPLYVLGRELQDLFPVAFLPSKHALAVAIMSYDGGMDFGLLGDYDAMPDLERLGEMLSESLAELVDAAEESANGAPKTNGRAASSRARTSRPRTSSRATTEA
jgi:WS/DGAT/MGAT family acyltransferase